MVAQSPKITAAAHAAVSAGMAVVIYARKSNEDKVESLPRQLEECREHCQRNGWTILREYVDNNRSGSRRDVVREQFDAMIADAKAGEFKAIVVMVTSRFARKDSLDGENTAAIDTLRRLGVHLESVRQGRIDWSTSMGRMASFMHAEADHDYIRNLSAQSVSGRAKVIAAGFWPFGSVPYGYDRQLIDETGTVRQTVARTAKSEKPKNWRVKLVINETEAEAVRYVFDAVADRDISGPRILRELADKGFTPPSGKHWAKTALTDILRNPAYIGEVRQYRTTRRNTDVINRLDASRVGTCPAIVSRETWDAAAAKAQDNRTNKRRGAQSRSSPLTGFIVCGHCGHRCVLCRQTKKLKDGTVRQHPYFKCESATVRPSLGCRHWRAKEGELISVIRRELLDAIDAEALRALQPTPGTDKPDEAKVKRLQKQADDLQAKIDRGTENILSAAPEHFAAFQTKLTEWRKELDGIRNAITIAETSETPAETQRILKWCEAVKSNLVTVRKMEVVDTPPQGTEVWTLKGAKAGKYLVPRVRVEADTLRNLLRRLNCRVTLHWTPRGKHYFHLNYALLRVEGDTAVDGMGVRKCKQIRPPARTGGSSGRPTRW